MEVSLSTSPSVIGLVFHAGTKRSIGDMKIVIALSSGESWRPDVGDSSTTGAISSVTMVAYDPLPDNFSIAIPRASLDIGSLY